MANTSSAKKAARQAVKRTLINKTRSSRIRSEVRKVEAAVKAGDHGTALVALREVEPLLMRGAAKGVMHKNAASRKVSRLTQAVKRIEPK
ncbi:MAG: 30S ribosomal protein S20 [Alphaproteobacteria bacterium]|nr:30S ribosomal protein S20 [Alphaproteobacteria bacterium]